MRYSARVSIFAGFFFSTLLAFGIGIVLFVSLAKPASAQTQIPTPTTPYAAPDYGDYREPNLEQNVPRNSHTYTQVMLIDIMSAFVCQLTGIDPTNPRVPCLGANLATNQIGYAQSQKEPQFGVQESRPFLGGALGQMTHLVSTLYTPTISTSDYTNYLANNFGITKSAYATGQGPNTQDCSKNSQLGYGFCGLNPVFSLWVVTRDFAYALLVIAFIFLGLGVMLRYKADSRTVMTLQNQIPRVIIAILLITFSYAIAGFMIDMMWTVTYAGVSAIASSSDAKVGEGCPADPETGFPAGGQSLNSAASGNILDNPISFANRIFLVDCEGIVDSGITNIAGRVSDSFIILIHSIIFEILGWDIGGECSIWSGDGIESCLQNVGIWIVDTLLFLIIVVTLFVALFRLWYELIKAYVTFFIFVIIGPIYIVFGLIPSRPLGFERWFRLIFANLAAFPLVALILVFGRVVMDSLQPAQLQLAPTGQAPLINPNSIYVPPLVGNPNVAAFNVLIAFGTILIAPSIPGLMRERVGKSKGEFGKMTAAGIAVGAGIATAPAVRQWKKWNKYNAQGEPEGFLARAGYNIRGKTPVGRYFRNKSIDMKTAIRGKQHGSSAEYRDYRRLRRYDPNASVDKKRAMFNRSPQDIQAQMIEKDRLAALQENARRDAARRTSGGGSGSGSGSGSSGTP